jgi:glucokinase
MHLQRIPQGKREVKAMSTHDAMASGPLLLAGDIGGTKTELAIYAFATGPHEPLVSERYPSTQYASLEEIVRQFLVKTGYRVDYACFDVAGPVIEGRARLTNLPWLLDENVLRAALGVKQVWLLNDLLAIANAVPHLHEGDLVTLRPGLPVAGGTIAVMAPGTGLGQAYLTFDQGRYHAHPSEGGHTNFGPTDQLQVDLLRYMWEHHRHVSYERVCSGLGIANIYRFLRMANQAPESPTVGEQLNKALDNDWAKIITRWALDEEAPCPLCAATLDLFAAILGGQTANMTLSVLGTGGVYMAGGIPRNILPVLRSERFMYAFTEKGRFAGLLAQVPIQVVTNSQVALIGAASYGMERAA